MSVSQIYVSRSISLVDQANLLEDCLAEIVGDTQIAAMSFCLEKSSLLVVHSYMLIQLMDGRQFISEKEGHEGILVYETKKGPDYKEKTDGTEIRRGDFMKIMTYAVEDRLDLVQLMQFFEDDDDLKYGLLSSNCHVFTSALWILAFGREQSKEIISAMKHTAVRNWLGLYSTYRYFTLLVASVPCEISFKKAKQVHGAKKISY